MQIKSKWPTILIVSMTLGLVFGPVFIPREIARWYLAAAQYALRNKDSVLADHYLARAEAWDPDIRRDGDYWIAQIPRAELQTVDELLDLVEKAVMTDSRWRVKAAKYAETLGEEYDFQRAVRALKIANLGQRPTSAVALNQLAYFRALAGIELDDALKDVDKAIGDVGEVSSLLDTKAWILHTMGRHLEALGFINDAIKGMEKEFADAHVTPPAPLALTSPPSPADDSSDLSAIQSDDSKALDSELLNQLNLPNDISAALSSLAQRKAELKAVKKRLKEAGYAFGVLHFHRLRILQSLKMPAEAALERRWLEERGIPAVDELF